MVAKCPIAAPRRRHRPSPQPPPRRRTPKRPSRMWRGVCSSTPRLLLALAIAIVVSYVRIMFQAREFNSILIMDIDNSPHNGRYSGKEEDQHHQSVLLSMTSIPKDELAVIPGKFQYGVSQNDETSELLVITAASITGDYHNPDALWFQFLDGGKDVQ